MTDDSIEKVNAIELTVLGNIRYWELKQARPRDIALIDEFVSVAVHALMTTGTIMRIDGEDVASSLVKHRFMRLTYDDIEHCIDQYKNVTTTINKKRQYITTMLYNSRLERDAHYTNAYHSDKWNGG